MHTLKVVSAIILIFVIIVSLGIYVEYSLFRTAGEVEKHIEAIENNIKAENWEDIDKSLKNIEGMWPKTEYLWTIFIDHFEIDNIDLTFTRMSAFIEAGDSESALAEAGALRNLVKNVPRHNSLRIKNIF